MMVSYKGFNPRLDRQIKLLAKRQGFCFVASGYNFITHTRDLQFS